MTLPFHQEYFRRRSIEKFPHVWHLTAATTFTFQAFKYDTETDKWALAKDALLAGNTLGEERGNILSVHQSINQSINQSISLLFSFSGDHTFLPTKVPETLGQC